jgi:hypothetical protein
VIAAATSVVNQVTLHATVAKAATAIAAVDVVDMAEDVVVEDTSPVDTLVVEEEDMAANPAVNPVELSASHAAGKFRRLSVSELYTNMDFQLWTSVKRLR